MNRPRKQYVDAEQATKIYILPNSLTAGNLFFGFLAIIRCIQAKYSALDSLVSAAYYQQAVWCILAACVFDLLDGRVARMGQKESLFGKEFDSIADMVSFGVAPALMVFFFILSPTEGYPFFRQIGWLVGFIYLLCAGIRLARFNVLTHPLLPFDTLATRTKDFLGLPVPMAAGFISSLVLLLTTYNLGSLSLVLPVLMVIVSWLMVTTIRYPSFKGPALNLRLSIPHFIILFTVLPMLFWFHEVSFSLIFMVYIFYGPTKAFWAKVKKPKPPTTTAPLS